MVRDDGSPAAPGEEGSLVIQSPWPGMTTGVYRDPQRFVDTYWSKFKEQGWYFTGDSARVDEEGYFWIIGRTDDVIKVSGYRLGTAEIESVMVAHPSVAEAAAIAIPHALKGNAIHMFVILKSGLKGSKELESQLVTHMVEHLGPIARPEEVQIVDSLPKTRSGKIMRRVLKARLQGLPEGDLSTLEE